MMATTMGTMESTTTAPGTDPDITTATIITITQVITLGRDAIGAGPIIGAADAAVVDTIMAVATVDMADTVTTKKLHK